LVTNGVGCAVLVFLVILATLALVGVGVELCGIDITLETGVPARKGNAMQETKQPDAIKYRIMSIIFFVNLLCESKIHAARL
jgi:hypothetical protein